MKENGLVARTLEMWLVATTWEGWWVAMKENGLVAKTLEMWLVVVGIYDTLHEYESGCSPSLSTRRCSTTVWQDCGA